MVSLKNVEPYLDGVKVYLEIGNLSSATYAGVVLKVKWGQRMEDFSGEMVDYFRSLRETEISLVDTLKQGSWSKVEFTLAKTKPERFGLLEVTLETNKLSLRMEE